MIRPLFDLAPATRRTFLSPIGGTLAAVGTALVLASAQSALAATLVSANATVNGGSQPAQINSSGSASQTKEGSDSVGTTASRASAAFGVLRTYGEARATPSSTFGLVFGQGVAFFSDDFRIEAPGRSGTTGSLTVKFTIDGALSSTASGAERVGEVSFARATYQFSVDGTLLRNENQRLFSDGTTQATSMFLNQEQQVTFNFTFGTPFEVKLLLQGSGQAYNRFSATAVADLENTAEWGGFGEVRDAAGNLVTDYAFSSGSGVDFTQPIPEPGTGACLLMALAVASNSRWTRHRS